MPTPRVGPLGILSATGNMLYRDANGLVDEVDTSGANNGDVLTRVAGLPVWQGAGVALTNIFRVFTANDAIYQNIAQDLETARIGNRNGRPVLLFDPLSEFAGEACMFADVMPDDWDSASKSLEVRLDWAADAGVVAGDVKWDVAFERLAIGVTDIDTLSFAAEQTVTDTTSGTTGLLTRTVIPFTTAQADGLLAGEGYRFQVQRDADAGGDDMLGDANLLRVSLAEV